MMIQFRKAYALAVIVACFGAALAAHPMMVKGTVVAVEPKRIQVRTGEEKKGEPPESILMDSKTKFFRGRNAVTYGDAKIKIGERVVVNADHDAKGVMTAIEVHLAGATDR